MIRYEPNQFYENQKENHVFIKVFLLSMFNNIYFVLEVSFNDEIVKTTITRIK